MTNRRRVGIEGEKSIVRVMNNRLALFFFIFLFSLGFHFFKINNLLHRTYEKTVVTTM